MIVFEKNKKAIKGKFSSSRYHDLTSFSLLQHEAGGIDGGDLDRTKR